jgi:iron(II)-dependent oxidoreductase
MNPLGSLFGIAEVAAPTTEGGSRPASDCKAELAGRLEEARSHTLKLVEPLTEEQLNRVYDPLLSPLIWDLGHIANFEELWLVQRIGGRDPLRGDLGELYDAIEQPRRIRGELPILRAEEVRPYMEDVRDRTLEVLDEIELDPEKPLLADGFIYEMLLAHEYQHNETMLQLLQMVESYDPVERDGEPAGETVSPGPAMVEVAGGPHEIGAADVGFAYDNERPRHRVELEPFQNDPPPPTKPHYISYK